MDIKREILLHIDNMTCGYFLIDKNFYYIGLSKYFWLLYHEKHGLTIMSDCNTPIEYIVSFKNNKQTKKCIKYINNKYNGLIVEIPYIPIYLLKYAIKAGIQTTNISHKIRIENSGYELPNKYFLSFGYNNVKCNILLNKEKIYIILYKLLRDIKCVLFV